MTAMIVITCILTKSVLASRILYWKKLYHHRGGKGFTLKGKPTFLSLLQHIKKNHDFNE